MKSKIIRVLIIEDNDEFRQSLKGRIAEAFPIMECEETVHGKEAVEKINRFHPDIIFSDLTIPNGNAFEFISKTREMCPNALIISMTHENSPEHAAAAMNCGASYHVPILKMDVMDELHSHMPQAIHDIAGNKRKSRRFRSRDLIYVNLKSESSDQWGKLLDISEGGLSLSYYSVSPKNGEFVDLRIVPSNDEFAIEDIKFRTVCDLQMGHLAVSASKNLRRRGVQFEGISAIQADGLTYFLENHTVS